jgi:hypothetical protein
MTFSNCIYFDRLADLPRTTSVLEICLDPGAHVLVTM